MTSDMFVLWHVHLLIQTMLCVYIIAFVFITTRKKKTLNQFVVLNEDVFYTSTFNLLASVESCELISVLL